MINIPSGEVGGDYFDFIRIVDNQIGIAIGDVSGKGMTGTNVLLAIGPEGGWNEYECERYLEKGFSMFTMGPRILHVDTAVVALLAQLALVRDN